jgi:hypothetical protein
MGVVFRYVGLVVLFSHFAVSAAVQLEDAARQETGTFQLTPGTVELHAELVLPVTAHDLKIDGTGVKIHFAADFHGRAAIVIPGGHDIKISGLSIDGNRAGIHHPAQGLAPWNIPFAKFTRDNGILAENVSGLEITAAAFHEIAGFAILVNASDKVRINSVTVSDSGSKNAKNRNNASGGILLEEGTRHFEVSGCDLQRVLGNGIWTHSLYTSPRNSDGQIAGNTIVEVARDAIQVGHGTRIGVGKNRGARIGYPTSAVDVEAEAAPCAIDTSGNTDTTRYTDNDFEEVNGKCIDLDGFHDGEVRDNSCINHQERDAYPNANNAIVMNNSNPDMQTRNILVWGNRVEGFLYSGMLVIGSGHRISHNHFLQLNMAHCNQTAERYGCLYFHGEPDLLRSGIYLRAKMERPADTRNNEIEDNEMSGFGIGSRCVVAGPGVDSSLDRIARNVCTDDAPVNARLLVP